MKRTFLAVDIKPTEKLKEDFGLMRYRLRLERINWVSEGSLHITTNFLGDTEEDLLPLMIKNLEESLTLMPAFELLIRSFGVFRNLHDPRVIWLGCDPCPALQQIKNKLDQILSGMGFKPESRDFSPHLTLGRVKNLRQINQLSQLITLYKDSVIQKQWIDHVILYESRLTPAGPEYIPIKNFLLQMDRS
jgi:RNA 2',3'-cyclic 3'-phosphodiesterase